ncbi:MAG TPA: twin-arginine translocase subunit TatC [Mycobacteriales bacterium]|jgi:sec-independent protein translocase protein TatC|nr:twin-arginine translocase subunit TatC [Mycobacteriales bacterium]
MTLVEHLGELRSRLFKSCVAVVITSVGAFAVHERILLFLTKPYCKLPEAHRLTGGHDCSLIVTGVLEGFQVSLKVSLYAGILVAAPIWLYQLWRFITPGLLSNERKYALTFVGASTALFAGGVAMAYLMLGYGLEFLLGFASGNLTPALKIDSYLSFMTTFAMAFGLAFEFPLTLVLLNLAGVLSYARMRSWWRGIVFGIFAFSAVATPTGDPFTMSGMALPMCLLFGVALLIARSHDARKARQEAEAPYANVPDDEATPLEMEPSQ